MNPIVNPPGGAAVSTYALLMGVGGILMLLATVREGASRGLPRGRVLRLFLWSWTAGWIGARLWFVVEHGAVLEGPRWPWLFHPAAGGFSSYGGLLAAVAVAVGYARLAKLPVPALLDSGAVGLCLFGIAARLGCFLAGCCHGRPSELPWAVTFPLDSPAVRRFGEGVGVHPTQLYEAAALALIAVWVACRPAVVPGARLLRVAAYYSVARFLLDGFRGDAAVQGGALSTAQWASLLVLAASAGLLWVAGRYSSWRVRATVSPC